MSFDRDDGEAAAILGDCRDAMRRGGRVPVVETVIPSGNGPCFGKWLDLMMLVVGGRERTEEQYEGLFSAAGLRPTRIVPTGHEVGVIEGVRAEQVRAGGSHAAPPLRRIRFHLGRTFRPSVTTSPG